AHPSSESARYGTWRCPNRCDPRLRGVQAPELPDEQEQAEQPRAAAAEEVLPLVPASHAAPRDPVGVPRSNCDPPEMSDPLSHEAADVDVAQPLMAAGEPDPG